MSRERIQLDSELDAAYAAADDSMEVERVHGRGIKVENEYSLAISGRLFASTPKAVFAAIAVSMLTAGGDSMERVNELILKEWQALYDNGIVPQKPPAVLQ
jgi:hypothetical protein